MKINIFRGEEVSYVDTTQVTENVICDVYSFVQDDKKDLGIVTVSPSSKTPLQKVLLGEKTLEIFVSGKGTLRVNRITDIIEIFNFPDPTLDAVQVNVGDVMQWEAAMDSNLVFAEICSPLYADGRFETILE